MTTDRVQNCATCPPGNPHQAQDGGYLVCWNCSNRLLRWLRELEDYLPTLSLIKATSGGERGAPGYASRPPLDMNALFHTDWRSDYDPLDGIGALACLHMWTRTVREERAIDPPEHITLASEIGCLRSNHQWLTCQPFIDELADDLRKVHGAVLAVAGDPAPRSVGRCITVHQHGECGGKVYERPRRWRRAVRHLPPRLRWTRPREAQAAGGERMTVTRVPASVALLALHRSGYTVTAATLRKWVQRGHITRTSTGYHLGEIVAYLDKRNTPRPNVAAGGDMCHAC